MNFKQSFAFALKSLKASKMRSFLTMLGIIIGVASVIIIVSLIGGMSNSMNKTFESMGTNLITVNVMGRNSSRAISASDMEQFALDNPDTIGGVSPQVSLSVTAKNGDSSTTTTVLGTNEMFPQIKNYEISSGRFIDYLDVSRRLKTCVVGGFIVKELYQGTSPIGKQIKLNNNIYTIVGVLTSRSNNEEDSEDDTVIIPYTCATRLNKNAIVSTYYFSGATKDSVNAAMDLIKVKLQSVFSDSNAYRVNNQEQMIEKVNELTGMVAGVLVGVAAISLLVGGIGIMNIMLVSVTERTREIGIRKSLGAKKRDILGQFVIEAATTSSVGGVIGIIFGIICALIVGKFMSLDVVPSVQAIVVAFSVSVAIGVTFGYFPARKAASLNPIEALRYD